MKRTFALTELIIVLLILGILVGLSMFKYTQSTRLANRTIFENNLKEIIKALEDYKMHQQFEDFSYPASLDMLKGSEIFTKEPINPYTGKSMLSNNSADSGLQYQSTGDKYKLCVVQNDIDDINNNGRIDDPLPVTSYPACTSTPSSW